MPEGYDASVFPVSYKDPAYDQADQAAAAAVGIPQTLLSAIRLQGEKSNANQISSANAATPYQITPQTRESILQQTGVDPYSSPGAAAYGAAYLLHQNLGRYGGNQSQAAAAYIGGTDQANWGPKTMAYAKRVTGFSPNNPQAAANPYQVQPIPNIGAGPGAVDAQGQPQAPVGASPYTVQPIPDIGQSPGAVTPGAGPSPLEQIYNAYQSGQMSPEDKAAFEQDVNAGRIVLPNGMNVAAPAPSPNSAPQTQVAPAQLVQAFNSGQMDPADAAQFQQDVQSGALTLPQGSTLTPPPTPSAGRDVGVAARGFLHGAADTVGWLLNPGGNGLENAIMQGEAQKAGVSPAVVTTPSASDLADQAMNASGLPTASNPTERTIQNVAQNAGAMAVPIPGEGLAGIVKMIGAGAAGGAVGEAVHAATGSPALGVAANLLTTVFSPAAAERIMGAIAKEAPKVAAGTAEAVAAQEAPQEAAAAQAEAPQAAAAAQAPAAAPPEATAEQAQMGAMEGQMQQAQARAAAAGEGVAPQQGIVGADEAAAGTQINPAAATEDSASSFAPQAADQPQTADLSAGSPLESAAQDFLPSSELAAQTRKAAGGAPLGIGKQTAQQVMAQQLAPDPARLAAAERLGIADALQPDHLSTNQSAIEQLQAVKSIPSSVARAQEVEGLQQVGQRAQQLVEDLGGMTDLGAVSDNVKNELMMRQQQLDQGAESLYSQLRDMVPAQTGTPADNTLAFIAQRAQDLGGAKNLSTAEKMIQAKLTPKNVPMTINGQEVDPAALGMSPQTQPPSYALLDDVRKNIGAGLRNQGPFKDADQGLLKALYGKLSEDQRATLEQIPGAAEKFDAARQAVAQRKDLEEKTIELFGKGLDGSIVPKIGKAISSLAAGDESKFLKIINAVPPSLRQEVAASALTKSFGKAIENGQLNFKTYADWMDGLKKNSTSFNALMGNLPPEARQQLLDLATVSRGIDNATKKTITTGRISEARKQLENADGIVNSIINTGRHAAVHALGTAATAGGAHVAGPFGAGLAHALTSALSRGKPDVMRAADALIVDPVFQQLVRTSKPTPQVVKTAANAPAFRKFYDAARAVSGANDAAARERWLLGLLNAERTSNSNSNR